MAKQINKYIYTFVSVFLFGLFGLLTRLIVDYFPTFSLIAIREGTVFLLVLFLTIVGVVRWRKIDPSNRLSLLLLGLISLTTNISLFFAFKYLQIGMASFLTFTSSILFSWVFGIFILKEKLTKVKVIALILVLIGIMTMFNIGDGGLNLWGIVGGIIAGLTISMYGFVVLRVPNQYDPLQIYMLTALVTSSTCLLISLISREQIPQLATDIAWGLMLVFSVVVLLGNAIYILALKKGAELSIVSIINPLQAPITALTGVLFLQELPTVNMIWGGLIILVAGILPSVYEAVVKKRDRNHQLITI